MFAVESFRHGLFDGVGAKIVREHRRPRHGLQANPVQSGRRNEGDNHAEFAEADEHSIILVNDFAKSS